MASLAVSFEAQPRGLEVVFDAAQQQQMLSFNLSVTVPLMDLFQAMKGLNADPGFVRRSTPPAPGLESSNAQPRVANDMPPRQESAPAAAWRELEPRKVPMPPDSQTPAMPTSPSKEPMLRALRHGDVAAVRSLLKSRQGELSDMVPRSAGSLLHVALESSGRLDLVKLLLEGRCDPNAVNAEGRSPLHLAVMEVNSYSPIVARLLLLARAEPELRDRTGLTPVDCLKNCAGNHAVSSNVKQIMSEMVGAPTQQVAVLQQEQVLSACFADVGCESVAFQTDQAVGFYDVRTGRVRCRKELSTTGKQRLRGMAVNPSTGGLVLLLEVGAENPQDLVMFWPSGQLEDEEPLKWTVEGTPSASGESRRPSTIVLSQGDYDGSCGPVILCRTSGGALVAWRLTPMGAQLEAERTLLEDNCGPLALSFHGRWAAVELAEDERLQVWVFEGGANSNSWNAEVVCTVERSPSAFAVIEDAMPDACLLAMTGLAHAPAQVWRVLRKGTRELVHRVPPNSSSNIRELSFCGEDSNALLGVLEDGLIMLCQLKESSQTCIFDDGAMRTVDISRDRSLMVTSLQECFRIFRVHSGGE